MPECENPRKKCAALIDGKKYPCGKKWVNMINREAPALMGANPDACKVRQWLRDQTPDDDYQWLDELLHLALMFKEFPEDREFLDKRKAWNAIPAQTRTRKINKIRRHIAGLIDALNDEPLPNFRENIVDLVADDGIFYRMDLVRFIHDHAAQTGEKPVVQETLQDVLRRFDHQLSSSPYLLNVSDDEQKKQRSGYKVREFARNMDRHLMLHFKLKKHPNTITTAITALRYPESSPPPSTSDIAKWIHKK